ncbi:COX15/CtaA family protein [Rarobacter faecitabidus]|uniref:Cytochrome c oxidase assembly protein subunit 15 n=1 Tax=Rarobacter faecitabidus TaxID=13243 RepID=A0A542ZW70_RARFA|nr:COX15/CtaA family protein [Rarobacter faecitabidus]TQL64562.1 cytochrome c oxidase assembly protein subunit 15 [Rarobacter faecitabidus]
MTPSPASPVTLEASPLGRIASWLRRNARLAVWANLAGQILIILTGGLVRLTGSGLGCSTWPNCEPGQFTPVFHEAVSYHPFVEFGNRTMSGVLSLLGIAVLVAVWSDRSRSRSYRLLGWVPLVGVIIQAVIGGITVLIDLHPAIVGWHMLISVGLVAASAYLVARQAEGDGAPVASLDRPTTLVSRFVAAWLLPVVMLGILTTGSGPHSGDDEIAYRFSFDPTHAARLHSMTVWVLVLSLAVLTVMLFKRQQPAPARSRRAAVTLWAIVAAEGIVGYVQFFTGLPAALVALHMLLAATITAAGIFVLTAARERN